MIKEIFTTPIYIGKATNEEEQSLKYEICSTLEHILTPPRKGQYLTKGNRFFRTVKSNHHELSLSNREIGVWYSDIRRIWDQTCIDGTARPPLEPLWVNRENVIKDMHMIECQDFISKHVNKYVSKTKWWVHETNRYKDVIDSSHINHSEPINDQNVKQHVNSNHKHLEADIACVYYVNVTENTGNIIFNRFSSFNEVHQFPTGEKYSDEYTVQPKNGMILIFPSTLTHRYEPSRDDKHERLSLVVNVKFIINNEDNDN